MSSHGLTAEVENDVEGDGSDRALADGLGNEEKVVPFGFGHRRVYHRARRRIRQLEPGCKRGKICKGNFKFCSALLRKRHEIIIFHKKRPLTLLEEAVVDSFLDDDEGELRVVIGGNLAESGLQLDHFVFHYQTKLTIRDAIAVEDDAIRQLA